MFFCSSILEVLYKLYTNLPFSHDFYSNWIGVGTFNVGDTSDHFNKMYYQHQDTFKRKDFYSNLDPVEFDDGRFIVRAKCEADHKPQITIVIAPKNKDELCLKDDDSK